MSENASPGLPARESAANSRSASSRKAPRRVVYRSRVDNGGTEDALVVGEDARDAFPRDLLAARDFESTAPSGQSADDRWLRENVPPHW